MTRISQTSLCYFPEKKKNTSEGVWRLPDQDTEQLQALKDRLSVLQDSGVVFPAESWPAKLLRSHPRYAPPSSSHSDIQQPRDVPWCLSIQVLVDTPSVGSFQQCPQEVEMAAKARRQAGVSTSLSPSCISSAGSHQDAAPFAACTPETIGGRAQEAPAAGLTDHRWFRTLKLGMVPSQAHHPLVKAGMTQLSRTWQG